MRNLLHWRGESTTCMSPRVAIRNSKALDARPKGLYGLTLEGLKHVQRADFRVPGQEVQEEHLQELPGHGVPA